MKSVRLAAACLVVMSGCVGTEIGNPQDGEVVLKVTPANEASRVGALEAGGGIEIDELTMSLAQVGFSGSCASEETPGSLSGRVLDLVSGGTRVATEVALGAPLGAYCGVTVGMSALENALEERPVMDGLSMRVEGTRGDGARFVMEDERKLQLSAKGEGAAVRLRSGERNMLFLVVDVAPLFDGEDLDGLEPGEDGVVRIDRDTNPQVLQRVRRRMKQAVRFGQDLDADGRPSDEELEGYSVDVSE